MSISVFDLFKVGVGPSSSQEVSLYNHNLSMMLA
ncbi:serine dehydratase beta chain [Vibrio pelagius]